MQKINLVILMAGEGRRFAECGYRCPKPFIEINKKMMIECVLDSFSLLDADYTLVLRSCFLKEQKEQLEKIKSQYNVSFVTVPKVTMGAAVTALAVHNTVNTENDIIFADSDNIYNPNEIKKAVEYFRNEKADGGLLTFKSSNPCYSYVKINEKGEFEKTREKEVISDNAICGVYYFSNIGLFKDAAIDLIVESDLSNGEFYMSNVYNHAKKFTNNIKIVNITSFSCVGTPEQLKHYKRKCNEV